MKRPGRRISASGLALTALLTFAMFGALLTVLGVWSMVNTLLQPGVPLR